MAELTITAANVRLGATAETIEGTAGETITPMMPLYFHSDEEYHKAANTSAVVAACKGLVIGYGEDGVKIQIVKKGLITPGATLVTNTAYVIGSSGKIMPISDLATGKFGTFLGWAVSTTVLDLQIRTSGVATP
jgi:hypothetical protein